MERQAVACLPDPVPSVRGESGYFRSFERRCGDGTEGGKSTEEIIGFLREAEVRIAQGETVGKICRGAGIPEQTYYKWRREYAA
ncbi:MAG: transposase [Hyphomicrobiaceae bacterium]